MEGGPPSFTPGLSYRALLRNTATDKSRIRLPGSHRLWPSVPGEFNLHARPRPRVLQPRSHQETGLGLGPFRSPLLRTSRLISLPPGTEMFQFPGFASLRRVMTGIPARRVAPFGHLGITACVPLPRASRSLPRPSSPPCAQASPTCLPSLDYKIIAKQNYAHCLAIYLTNLHVPLAQNIRHHAECPSECTRSSVKIPYPTNRSPAKRPDRRPILYPSLFNQRSAMKLSR